MKKNIFNIILIMFWIVIVAVTASFHELWRDEAQVWCIARDCNFLEMLNMARIEGHPVLWYIIIFPFAKSGFDVSIMQILSILLNTAAVFILLTQSNLSRFQKIITVFSAGLLYYFPIIARNYALIPVSLFLISLFWEKRQKYPYVYTALLILLSQTHSYMLGLYLILALLFITENKNKFIFSSIILFINSIYLFFWFKSGAEINYALHTISGNTLPFPKLIIFLSQIYLFDIVNTFKPLIKYAVPFSVISFIPFIAIYLAALFKENKKIFIILAVSISFVLHVFSTVYFNGILYQKLFLIILLLIFGFTLQKENKNKLMIYSLNILLIISCFSSFIQVKKEIMYNFSGGRETAEYIKQNYYNETVFIAEGNPYLYSSVSAYLPNKKFYSPIIRDYISYYTYNPKIQNVPFPNNASIFITDEKTDLNELGLKAVFESNNSNLSSQSEREIFKIAVRKTNSH